MFMKDTEAKTQIPMTASHIDQWRFIIQDRLLDNGYEALNSTSHCRILNQRLLQSCIFNNMQHNFRFVAGVSFCDHRHHSLSIFFPRKITSLVTSLTADTTETSTLACSTPISNFLFGACFHFLLFAPRSSYRRLSLLVVGRSALRFHSGGFKPTKLPIALPWASLPPHLLLDALQSVPFLFLSPTGLCLEVPFHHGRLP